MQTEKTLTIFCHNNDFTRTARVFAAFNHNFHPLFYIQYAKIDFKSKSNQEQFTFSRVYL